MNTAQVSPDKKSRSRVRIPLRVQISALLIFFVIAVALISYRSTQRFLFSDKIATVRELQTLQVAQNSSEIREKITQLRQKFREALAKLQNPSLGAVDLDPTAWAWVKVGEKEWRSNKISSPTLSTVPAGTPKFNVIIDPQDSSFLVLVEPIVLQDAAGTHTLMALAKIKKSEVLGDAAEFSRGIGHNILLNAGADVESKIGSQLRGADANSSTALRNALWAGTTESAAAFSHVFSTMDPAMQSLLFKVSAPTSREIPVTGSDNSWMLAWSRVSLSDTQVNLVLVQFIDRETILKGFRKFLIEQAFYVFLLLGFGIIAASFLARRLSKPIERLVHAAAALETGDFKVRVDSARRDEMGDLARAFNHMAGGLEQREEDLKSAQAALVQNEKLAALGTLSAGIAHEVKNPLAGILGNADMALSQLKTLTLPPQNSLFRYLEIIQKETKRCRGIIDSLMRFSRQEKAEFLPFDLELIGWEAIHLMEHSLNIAGVRMEKDFAADLKMVNGNANQIEQVLLNIIQNGGQAMPDGGLLVVGTRLFAEAAEAQPGKLVAYVTEEFKGAVVRVFIRDAGVGMSDEVQKKIFEPFFTTKPKGVGTGLGLSVTMGILAEHKARLSLNSSIGKGTEFMIDFAAHSERSAEIQSQLSEIKHRRAGGEKLATDVGAPSTVVEVLPLQSEKIGSRKPFAPPAAPVPLPSDSPQAFHEEQMTRPSFDVPKAPQGSSAAPQKFTVRKPVVKSNG